MTPYVFTSSAVVLTGVFGFVLMFFNLPFGAVLLGLAAWVAYMITSDNPRSDPDDGRYNYVDQYGHRCDRYGNRPGRPYDNRYR